MTQSDQTDGAALLFVALLVCCVMALPATDDPKPLPALPEPARVPWWKRPFHRQQPKQPPSLAA